MLNFTPFLRAFALYRNSQLRSADPAQTQERELLKLTRAAANTKIGQEFDFGSIKSVQEYQRRVPVRPYEQFWEQYWKAEFPKLQNCTWPGMIPFFAVSSGTSSGRTKYIPLSNEMIKSNTKAGTDLLVHHVTNRPNSNLMGGKSFVLGGSTDLVEQAPGILSGDLSGIAVKTLPWWAAMRYFPPPHLALLKNWDEKIDRLAQESLKDEIRMISGVPSWMLIFFEKLWELKPETRGTLTAYPNLEMLVHGGVNFAPYLKQFREILSHNHAELREVYPASEGFMAIADRSSGEGMRVVLDHGLFYEFIPVSELSNSNPTRHWIGNIEMNVDYAVVLTTCAGLWSYLIGDTVKFVDTKIPRLLVTGRTSYYLSAFGEHLTGEEVERAISDAAAEAQLTATDYSIGALYPEGPGQLGGHLVVVEFSTPQVSIEAEQKFTQAIDRRLCELNEDYEAHRASGFGLNPPKVRAVHPGFFAAWMKSRGKLGGQNKVPRIITDPDLFRSLKDFQNP